MKTGKYIRDIALIGALILIGVILLIVLMVGKKDGKYVQILDNGKLIEKFSIDEDREYTIKSSNGGENILVIKDGYAYVKDASCPDKLCEKMGKINSDGQSIVCLPNKIVIEITDASDKDDKSVDLISQ